MAAPTKQTSRWGSFLQQAVAGVESSLDNILAGNDEPQKPRTSSPSAASAAGAGTPKSEAGISKTPSSNVPTNDRLQERLARAVASKNLASQRSDVSRSSSPGVVLTSSTAGLGDSPRRSVDTTSINSDDKARDRIGLSSDTTDNDAGGEAPDTVTKTLHEVDVSGNDQQGPDTADHEGPVNSASIAAETNSTAHISTPDASDHTVETSNNETITLESQTPPQLSNVRESTDQERQADIQDYIERIDTLQAKLQYLARESASSARKLAEAASPNSVEKKLAEKDEQIALLMEEGQKLSKTELRQMTTIKKLRSKVSETEKEASEISQRLEKAEKEKSSMLDRLRRADTTERQSLERQKLISQLQKELEAVRSDRDAKNRALVELKAQASESASQKATEEKRTLQEQLDAERRRVTELENDLSSVKIEKELEAGKAKAHIEEVRAKNERESERARVAEVELRGELQMLESRLEVMRARAEEASSGTIGDTQAKLLRQVETLQTQHAIASENWQGIEASLRSRVSSLEKERDEALKRESDIRRKAREVALKGKQHESDLDDAQGKIDLFQQEITEQKEQIDKLQKRIEEAESSLLNAQKAFDQEKQTWKQEAQQRLDEEREKWREEVQSSSFGLVRSESPLASLQKGLTGDYLGLQGLQARRASSRSNMNELADLERRLSRPSSAQRMQSSGQGTPQRQDSTQSFLTGEMTDTPTHAMENDDYFENVLSPSSPPPTTHDIISVSTVGAGPSVQLVERMSAAIRRLESEKVSTKEEVVRLTSQRDEARAEIVTLIRDLEAKNAVHSKIQELEEENKKINARYQTTLEMLGEKSELVEELRADVEDVKAMYRELVERTVK